ncbi:unnamed protein product [Paramecium sonneborni]|uniref:Laminin EGF-like domain-containing protein n=1 Tax=Paramecium sonneborni TaxID=65129 RepID=A0A8S1LH21_9CILI|nr:unnamed protein product [Paramecium sonneborni]
MIIVGLVQSTCEVFKTITTPDTGEHFIEQDLSSLISLDYAWGVWSKYSQFYISSDDLALPSYSMHIVSEKQQDLTYLVYYITLNKKDKSFYHNLYIFNKGSYVIRELRIDQALAVERWVFFYFCYKESQANFNIFLYVQKEDLNVQKIEGGPCALDKKDFKEYQLGGSLLFTRAFEPSEIYQLKQFSGQISNIDLREGSQYYYTDIPTFLNNLEQNCQIDVCEMMVETLITSFMKSGGILRKTVTYFGRKFMISGWAIIRELSELKNLESVLFRASLRYSYFQDKNQGDKAIYWKYIQNSLNQNLNGFQITTYHHYQSESLNSYETQEQDSWLVLDQYYYEALTFWHWFVYQEGVDGTNNIRLSIYMGHGKQEKTFIMKQNHLVKAKLYLNIGGDKYNQNFNGAIRDLTFKYCYNDDTPNPRQCHFTCKSCFGPLENHCISCEEIQISNRKFSKSQCLCQEGYVDVGTKNCKIRGAILKNINIQEATTFENFGCQRYQFQVNINGDWYCLDCPGTITPFALYCLDCIQNSDSWYLNPRCTTDYLMPFTNDTNYVFLKQERQPQDYEYFLINLQGISQQPVLEPCFGCLGQTNSSFNFIEKQTMNQISKILCKNCYQPINGECVKFQLNCNQCDDNHHCLNCLSNYTLFENFCWACPIECPDCNYNMTGYYCKSCIQGYYFNSTLEQCQQCGQFCKICIFSLELNHLQCVRCNHDSDYFISVEKFNCRKKSMPNCEMEASENYIIHNNLSYISNAQQYSNSLDIVAFKETFPTFQICLKCENGYINKLLVQKQYECVSIQSLGTLLPEELKLKVLQSQNNNFQLALISKPQAPSLKFSIIYGDRVSIYTTLTIISNSVTGISCQDPNCFICVNNYIQEQQYCMQCYNGFYSNTFLGRCYQCPSDCSTCLEQNKIYQDAWKWQYKINYHFRSYLLEGLHNFNVFGAKLDLENFEVICTACPQNGILYNNKCYPKCNCDSCIIQNDQVVCISCKNQNTKTVYDGYCHLCPKFCELCREITQEEKLKINPYFQPTDINLQKYAQQCIKPQSEPPIQGILYYDPTLGQEINCLNPEKKNCYLYLEIPLNIYCSKELFEKQYAKLDSPEDQDDFLSKNAPISAIFSTDTENHFLVETDYLYNELNQKTVKLVRYILNLLPNSGDCEIKKNTYIQSQIRRNVFTVKYLELILESQNLLQIHLNDNITFYEFTTIKFINLQMIPNHVITTINIYNLYGVSFFMEQIKINNIKEGQVRIKIENPTDITIQNFEISDSNLNNLNGIIFYYFTQKLRKQLMFKIDQFIIQNCQINNTTLIFYLLDEQNGNQQLIVSNFNSWSNYYSSSIVFYTEFINQIRQATLTFELFNSDHDVLINSGFLNIPGALNVELINMTVSNGTFNSQVQLFKLPLFKITNMLISNNTFNSFDNRVITNILDTLYKDTIQSNLLIINKITFKNNYFRGSKVFIELLKSDNFQNLEVNAKEVILDSNQFVFMDYNGFLTSANSSFYFDLNQIILEDVNIIRTFTLPEISINNAEKIVLNNMKATLKEEFNIKLLHQQESCIQKNLEIGYSSMIFIYNTKHIQIQQIKIIGLIVINLPIILIKSLEKTNFRQTEIIDIQTLNLSNNNIILTNLAESPSILSINSEQEQKIKIINITAFNNHHHTYQDNQYMRQSSTIFIENPNSNILLSESKFSNNIITNNQGSNLVLICKTLEILNCSFKFSNYLQFQYLRKRLIWGYRLNEVVYMENLYLIFPIKSKGGNAYLQADSIILSNVSSQNSLAWQGGSFYFGTQSNGLIQILNCNFNFSQANLIMTEKSQGGTLFVDASQSDLNLRIFNSHFISSFSRQEGGTIFIEPSRNKNFILITQNVIRNVYSLANAFFKLPIIFTSNTLVLNVEIYDLSIQNDYQGFLSYLASINNLSESELKIQIQNYLISIERGNITLKDCNFIDIFDYGVLDIKNAQSIKLENVLMQNFTLIGGSTVKFILNKKYLTNIQFLNVKLMSFKEVVGNVTKPSESITSLPQIFYKCITTYSQPGQLKQFYDQKKKDILSYSNLYALIQKKINPIFIIEIDSISINHYISIDILNLQKIICSNCQNGLLRFTNVEEQSKKNLIYLKQIKMEDNVCGQLSCLIISSKEINQLKSFSDIKPKRLLNQIQQYQEMKLVTVKLEFSSFQNNSATYGGAILISGVSIVITSCQFLLNCVKETGGAIYFQYNNGSQFQILNSLFSNNQAQVGGAIFLENYAIQNKEKTNIVYSNNQAALFGNNIADFPAKLTLKFCSKLLETKTIVNNQSQVLDKIDIQQYFIGQQQKEFLMLPSGQPINQYHYFDEQIQDYIALNLTLRIIPLGKENGQIKALNGSKCKIKGREIINGKEGEFNNNFTSFTEIEFNTTSQDYNLDFLNIYFDPNYTQQDYLQLEIMCDSVKIPIFDDQPPYLLNDYQTNYGLRVNLQTYPCQRGEYKTQSGTCKLCDPNSYQYNVRAGEQCKIKDQIKMEKITSARIMLRPQYWRPYENNDNVEYCLNMPENCIGGWNPGNDLCSEAHIGALCEQCDIYNVRGQGSFSVSTIYKCGDCNNVSSNTFKVILVSIWTMISILLSVKGTIETITKAVVQQKRVKLKIATYDPRTGYGNVLIKVLTNYFQIIGVISTFQLSMPSILESSVRSVGNPTETMSLSLDCFLIQITDIDIIYFRMIWALVMPFLYILTFIFIYMIAVVINITKLNKSAFTTTAIYLFIYFQPTLIGGFISLLSFRQISSFYWIQGNVAYRYDTQEHLNWIITFILPSTLALALIIPAYMFINLYIQRQKLEEENTRKNWGYLYNEYSKNAYFWEIVKILQKGFIIIFLTFYEDLVIIKGALVFMIVFLYQLLTRKYRPYQILQLNIIDELSTLICGTSIVLSITIYQANISENQEIILPFYIFLIGLNATFILVILWGIFLAQLEDQQQNIDKIRDKINQIFPRLVNSNQILRKLLTNRAEKQQRIRFRFLKIKKYLLQIVHAHPGLYKLPIQNYQLHQKRKSSISSRGSDQLKNYQFKPKTFSKVYPIYFEIQQLESQKGEEQNQQI